MKQMSDRKMDMGKGQPKSDGFFPEEAHNKVMARPGEIRDHKYPDTEQMVKAEQDQMVSKTNANMPKTGYRH
jgi:hypothetical protein